MAESESGLVHSIEDRLASMVLSRHDHEAKDAHRFTKKYHTGETYGSCEKRQDNTRDGRSTLRQTDFGRPSILGQTHTTGPPIPRQKTQAGRQSV